MSESERLLRQALTQLQQQYEQQFTAITSQLNELTQLIASSGAQQPQVLPEAQPSDGKPVCWTCRHFFTGEAIAYDQDGGAEETHLSKCLLAGEPLGCFHVKTCRHWSALPAAAKNRIDSG